VTDNDSRNPYAPPKAPVDKPARSGASGSFAAAISGEYEFTISEVMNEAWGLVDGFKGTFWAVAIVVGVVLFALQLVWGEVVSPWLLGPDPPELVVSFLSSLVESLMAPLFVGLTALAVRRASGLPVSFPIGFVYLNRASLMIGAALLTTLLTYAGLVLLILPGLYLSVAYTMTMPLLAFHDMRPWAAMETSRKAITHKWFSVFGLLLVSGAITAVSAMAFLIPLIWTIPWMVLVVGVLYRRMFGAPAIGS
jgi:hypothetical protein